MDILQKQTIFSGIQPSGTFTIGNYIGAIRNWKLLEEQYNCLYCVVDLHSLTTRQDPVKLRKQCVSSLALLLAVGLDPKQTLVYFQSHVPAHAELAWVLNCFTYLGELSRMTQFKDKSVKNEDNLNAGLFTYPVLMAADILAFQSHLVPIGADQKQHLELARDLAIRFNNLYGDTFVVPEGYFPKVGARIMSLSEPTHKMSKSDPEDAYIALLDTPDVIRKKIKRAVTDSDGAVRYDPVGKPGVSNLLTILSVLSGTDIPTLEATFGNYGTLKNAVAEQIVETLTPIQAEHQRLMLDKVFLETTMKESAEKAIAIGSKTMHKVRKKTGLAPWKL